MQVNGGQLTQTSGNPVWPGSQFTGPLLAGNVFNSDGTGNLAGAGEQQGTANVGYVVMAQTDVITQATNGTSTGVFTSTNIVIPAQSQILRITFMVTTGWSGASKTLGIGNTVSPTAYTAAGAADGTSRGLISFSPGSDATIIGNWDNVGASDVQLVITSTNTGNGVGTLVVEYLQGINQAS